MFGVSVYCVEHDADTAELVRRAYGEFGPLVTVSILDRDPLTLPALAGGQHGPCVLIVSSQLLRRWFGGAAWPQAIATWRTAGGKALVVHPDSSGGPLDWPELELGRVRLDAREQALCEFFDVPRELTLDFDADLEDDAVGSLAHARGIIAWQRGAIGDAREHFERAVAERAQLHEGDPRRAASENALGGALARTGEFARAIPCFERALGARRTWLGTRSPQAAATANNLGIALINTGDARGAAALLAEAAETMLELGGSYDARARACAAHLAAALEAIGDRTGASTWRHIAGAKAARPSGGDDLLN